jgi:hypothetical protein
MRKVIVPVDVAMSEDIFLQDPKLFMNNLIGSIVKMRVANDEQARLELLFGRLWIKDILAKDSYTWQDYESILNGCL